KTALFQKAQRSQYVLDYVVGSCPASVPTSFQMARPRVAACVPWSGGLALRLLRPRRDACHGRGDGRPSDFVLARWHRGLVRDDAKKFVCKSCTEGRHVAVQGIHLGAQSDNVFTAQWTDDHFPQANVVTEFFEEKVATGASRQ